MKTIDARILVVDIDQRGAALISLRCAAIKRSAERLQVPHLRPPVAVGRQHGAASWPGRSALVCQLQLS